MSKIPFQEMTNGEKYKTFKKKQVLATAGKITSVFGPLAVLFGVKFNEYFQLVEGQERVKLTIGCVVAIIVACVAVLQEFKSSESTKHLVPAVGWTIAAVLSWLMEIVLQDLTMILVFEAGGQWASAGLDAYAKHCEKEAEEYKKLARADRTLGVKRPKKKKVSSVPQESDSWF